MSSCVAVDGKLNNFGQSLSQAESCHLLSYVEDSGVGIIAFANSCGIIHRARSDALVTKRLGIRHCCIDQISQIGKRDIKPHVVVRGANTLEKC